MSTTEDIKSDIQKLMPHLVSKYHILQLYLFGSYARGDQNEKSDIDLLVDFSKTPDLLTFIEIEEFLKERLHHSVDLVPRRRLKHRLKEQILHEAIAI